MFRSVMLCAAFAGLLSLAVPAAFAAPIPVLILDGRNNHDWLATTPVLKHELEETSLFRVDVATAPKTNQEMKNYRPAFSKYRVVVLNYTDLGNGGDWPKETKQAFVEYVAKGGGVVAIHAALSAFPEWKQYNKIIGLGGWGGRDEYAGPYLYFKDGKEIRDTSPGIAGHHGTRHRYLITIRDRNHPITKGLPATWTHVTDELYDSLRGPAQHLTLLATAYSDPATGGTGRDEPVLFTVRYRKGCVVGLTLGHDVEAVQGMGFTVIFQRSTEWAGTGRVTQQVPKNFPTAYTARSRPN